ncbi:molybdopterin-dependent oxidoreductase [Thalassoglobus sp. JC818]|uniref:molybdopterin-dependent oxidoreductase n=1 Tax=Thalassoglobus sp. JC818 TaxID=3232136 RepID=UPI00345AED85
MTLPAHSRRSFLGSSLAAGTAAGLGLFKSPMSFGQEAPKVVGKLKAHTTIPMNAEPALNDLIQSWMTPTDLFYIRSHAPVPEIDTKSFRLKVEGMVEKPLELSLEEIANLPQQEVVATMTCAGNRRYEHSRVSPIKGVPWQEGAIGNAKWSGAILSSILKKAGVRPEASHVWFDGLDVVPHNDSTIPFGASIPLRKAMDDTAEMPGSLLCTKMNGEALTPDHGWPLRTVVPGYIGARSVKWLGKITLSDRTSPNHYVATAYKVVEEGNDLEWDEKGPIYRYPINSVICNPSPSESLNAGQVTVAGYALPPGYPGVTIRAVQVSADGGKTWKRARVSSPVNQYCWVLWSTKIDVKSGTDEIIVRAIDSTGDRQPRSVDWNLKGYLFNAWHRVPVKV